MRNTLADVTWAVSVKFQLSQVILREGKRRDRKCITRPRQIAMYLAREFTGRSYPEIARWFNRDYTTARYAHIRIRALVGSKPILAAHVEELAAALPPMIQKRKRAIQGDVERLWAGEVSWSISQDKLPPARF